MKRVILLILILFLGTNVFAGEYEDTLEKGKPVVLYIYASYCKYCKEFEPVYYKLFKFNASTYNFVKLDAQTQYGAYLMRKFGARYVPFVVLSDLNKQKVKVIEPSCSIDYACVNNELKQFLK